jgi:quercetin dioxygenase-like cupin family protein
MARISRLCARGIFAALVLTSFVGVPPVAAETVLRVANMAEPETLDPHKTVQQQQINITRNLFEGLVAFQQGPGAGRSPAAGGPAFIVTDMYTGPDGLTHLRNKEIKLGELEKAAAIVIGRISANPSTPSDWHNAPSWPRYVVPLSGRFEVEVSSDGTIKSFGPGDILLAEDTNGKGHKTRAVGGDCVWLFVELGDPKAPGASNGVRNQ